MNRIVLTAVLASVCLSCCYAEGEEPSAAAPSGVVFARDIQPLLAKHCILCHGPDEAEAGLRLDVAEQAYAKLDSDMRAIVPGNADASELMRRVTTTDEFERMPPEGELLTKDQIALFRKWINEGAQYQQHWAYEPVKEPSLPAVENEAWVRSPIDRFVLARLEQDKISPAPEAETSHRFPPSNAHEYGRRRRPGGVSRRSNIRSHRDDCRRLDELDDDLCPLPLAQIRPDYAARILPIVRLLQQRERSRH